MNVAADGSQNPAFRRADESVAPDHANHGKYQRVPQRRQPENPICGGVSVGYLGFGLTGEWFGSPPENPMRREPN